ncbi:MAG: DNA polymerase III subunit alpha [Omnitrophica bacterium GWA2_41_15]|nr:MAG: DNA polymerase III subunit alpha [Omnitrophica bacterium GWA2_41_15]HAZ09791.1 DNA polymerase III subunit alpha [Candidatus Omnitrophota bacterium]
MLHSDFVHLHVHTQYSLLDGACLIKKLTDLARRMKMPACAITDHGNMFGAIEFYQSCITNGIKPIIGSEVYIAPKGRLDKTFSQGEETANHLILLVRDEAGYKNLMKLVSIGYLEGFYYKPRIDKEALAQYSEGLIALSSCLKGEIPRLAMNNKEEKLKQLAAEYCDILGKENFYFELQDNSIPEQREVNKELIRLGKELGIGLVATNDVHYLTKDSAKAHEALLCIQTQTTLDDPNRMKLQTDQFYFKSTEEMKALFKDVPEAISNTIKIAERCNLELDFKKTFLPHYIVPHGVTREKYMKDLCEQNLLSRYKEITPQIKDRLENEVRVISKAGYTSYFLIVWDFINYAKSKGIAVGPGRGSAAGSIVSYLLGITDIDPLRYNLLFERFLNSERVSMPDIDIDFCYEKRGEVIDYVIQKYGKDNVAQIITFGTMAARAVIRDTGRAMNIPYADVDKIAKLVPIDPDMTLELALEQEPELARLYKEDSKIRELINISKKLEGLTRHASTHAAGVVISEDLLTNHVPLFKTSDGQISTGYAMGSLEKIGLLKMDFLGLRTLTVIQEALKIINRVNGVDLKVENIPMDDPKTYKLLNNAESTGIFQLESSGMRDLLRKLKAEKFEDIIALLALYRPGPIGSGMLDDYIKRKHGKIEVRYDHPLLEASLKETYGVIVYQEQVMMIVSSLAGFSLAQADILRRAIGKKTPEIMEQQRKAFIDGAVKNKIERRIAEKIFSLIEHFAGYGFNKSHSAAYATISYRTAYLKANYPVEFMTALLTSEKDNTDKIVEYIDEAERMGIKILPPDVNESYANFTMINKNEIRFGLSAVKNVGEGSIESIIEARKKYSRFPSLYEFCERTDLRLVNKKVLESLIKCGAFDSMGLKRSQLMATLVEAMDTAVAAHKESAMGQMTFFMESSSSPKAPDMKEWPESQLLNFEKEMLGLYITGHPLAVYEKIIKEYSTSASAGLKGLEDGQKVWFGGIINKIKNTVTKRSGEKMAIMMMEDMEGSVEALVFPNSYKNVSRYIALNAAIFVNGRLSLKEERPKIIVEEIIPITDARKRFTLSVSIDLLSQGMDGMDEELFGRLRSAFSKYQGDIPVYLNFTTKTNGSYRMLVDRKLFVSPTNELASELETLIGREHIKFEKT